MPRPIRLLIFAGLCSTLHAADEVRFNRDVRPILSDKCYFCHGPDEEVREADLRLDLSDGARDVLESGELLRRINSDDSDERMPPPGTKLSLTAADKLLLKRWVEQGATYERHWAFAPLPATVAVPFSEDDDWSQQQLDQFVWQSLRARKLRPNAEADSVRWLRRVTFDLTGLPPTVDEIDEFEQAVAQHGDREPAYRAAVDRLLQSSSYGEHMAIAWLDAARYADSYGYQSDKLNTQWPYRDWVVRAFNDNLSYDHFLIWQLAGDLLEAPTRDQRLATAFNRLHRLNNEGGAVFEEWRHENVADRVQTFGTAVLGLTLECCRCHDHKYDPIPTRDYYALSAFFNSIDESGVYDRTEKVPAPSLLLPTAEQSKALTQAGEAVLDAESDLERVSQASQARFELWNASPNKQPREIPDLRLALSFDVPFNDSEKDIYYPSEDDRSLSSPLDLVSCADSPLPRLAIEQAADLQRPGQGLSADEQTEPRSTPERHAIQLDGDRGITAPGIGPFDRWTPFTVVVSLRETIREPQRAVIAHHTRGTDCGYNGWDLTIADGYLESRLYRIWPGNAIGVRTLKPIPADRWQQVTTTYDGSSTAAGLKLFLDGQPLATKVLRDNPKKAANLTGDKHGEFVLGQRFRSRGFAGGLIDDIRVYDRALTPSELVHLANGAPMTSTPAYFAAAINDESRQARTRLEEARKAWVMAEEAIYEIPVMEEMAAPRDTHVLARGAYDAETNDQTRVTRDTFSELQPPFPDAYPRNRLGLARWATLSNHPLTSRVIVNRLWKNFFGYGLVRTPENFGLQGQLPTHPELLDWLARDFVDHGWDIKRFCRQVVLSATYRQDSQITDHLAENDPDNRWLARGPAHRLQAEQIRDLALAASGLLNPSIGGPPVSPYQPGGDLWKESNSMSPAYQQSVGHDLYRRTLYSVWKRTAPLPNMMAFDTQSREVCTVNRARTNTPLQALVLLNDVQFVEAARRLAEKTLQQQFDANRRIAWVFRCLTGRRPDSSETTILASLFADESTHYAQNVEAAAKLITLGDSQPNKSLDVTELAAMTVVCQAILNLDATVWKR